MATTPSSEMMAAGRYLRAVLVLLVCIVHLASPSTARSQGPDTSARRSGSNDSSAARYSSKPPASPATTSPAPTTTPAAAASDSAPAQLQFVGVKAAPNGVHGVVSGGSLMLQLNRAPRTDTPLVALIRADAPQDSQPVRLSVDAISGTNLFVRIPQKTRNGRYRILVYSDTDPKLTLARAPQEVLVRDLYGLLGLALVPVLVMVLIIWLVVRRYRPMPGEPSRNWLQLLLIDPRSNTYSLSRAQFLWWTSILVFSYCFLFIARALVEHIYEFPSLDGFAWTFLISLGTLLGAQATEQAKGSKGAGSGTPVLSDLFLHGGVIALERVQQVLWTLVGSAMFVVILLKNYAVSTTMPVIPQELLAVMGLSSAGYLGGKMIRNPGPVLSGVTINSDGSLSITGQNLAPNAKILVDGVPAAGVNMTKADPTKSGNNATELNAMPAAGTTKSFAKSLLSQVVVLNPDGQRAMVPMNPSAAPPEVAPSVLVSSSDAVPPPPASDAG